MDSAQEPDEYPEEPAGGKGVGRGASAERMREITRLRMEKAKTDPKAKGGRPRVKLTKEEAERKAIDAMTPQALKVLKAQLDSPDEAIAQRAARMVLEYKMGKPTQKIEQESKVAVIRYESAAWTYGQADLELEAAEEVLELEQSPDG